MNFQTTSWSLIVKATAGGESEARAALALLCETYWPPVYAFIRRKGHSPADAEDLTQAYFARFLEKRYLEDFRPEAGRFRTFLRASVGHFLANEWHRERTLKRGAGRPPMSLDAAQAEPRLERELVDALTPETLFERQWAATMLRRCLLRLGAEHDGPGSRERFEKLKPHLVGDGGASSYGALARELGTTETAARVAVHRLRKRFCTLLREEVLRTVTDPGDVDAELRWLLTTVRSEG